MRTDTACWSESFGPRGYRVRVYERRPGGTLHYEYGPRGHAMRGSLRHRDRAKARTWALRRSDELRAGVAETTAAARVSRVVALYLEYASAPKVLSTRRTDERTARMWIRLLGPGFDLHQLDSAKWERVARDRAAGAIDAGGEPVPAGKRVAVRARTVRADLQWLRTVVRWALRWRTPEGSMLMREDPTRYLPLPRMGEPRRPVLTQDRLDQLREVADQVMVQARRPGWRAEVRSYLAELIDIVDGTGRRFSAVAQLRVRDLHLERTATAPHGAVVWPAGTDKKRKQWAAPISARTRAAIEMRLQAIERRPDAYLFPSPSDPGKPCSKEHGARLLRRAEELAGLEPLDGSLWHTFRRKWATERKHLPPQDVSKAGGWRDLRTMMTVYQQADDATLYRVVSEPRELREIR